MPACYTLLTALAGSLVLAACGASIDPTSDPPDEMQVDASTTAPDVPTVVARDAAVPADGAVGAAGCALAGRWHGLVAGNATDVDATLDLTVDPDCVAVHGQLGWRSAVSGTSDRTVAGAWDGSRATLTLHDVAFVDSSPNPGWRFCLIDHYDLVLLADGDHLNGAYTSAACDDHAHVALVRAP